MCNRIDCAIRTQGIEELLDWAIIDSYRGSVAHGTFVPSTDPDSIDDIDTLSVIVPPVDYYFGLKEFGGRGTYEKWNGEYDMVFYEIRKFVRLLSKGNPNVLGVLWLDSDMFIRTTQAGRLLLDARDLFSCRSVFAPFLGYAKGQLKRMTAFSFAGYMGTKRKGLVEKHGYDTKNAAHCIRIMRMGIEFLDTGRMIVKRPDAQELIAIKRGEFDFERIRAMASELTLRLEEAFSKSRLPDVIDEDAINRLTVKVVQTAYGERSEPVPA